MLIYAEVHTPTQRLLNFIPYEASEDAFTSETKRAFYFDIGVPTEEVEINIKYDKNAMMLDAELHFVGEELRIFGQLDPIHRGLSNKKDSRPGHLVLRHKYPPLTAEMVLLVDAKPVEQKPK